MPTIDRDKARRVVRRLRIVRTPLDRDVRQRAERTGQPVSCARSCAHCCETVVLIDWPEAIALVHAYVETHWLEAFRERLWPRPLRSLEVAKTCAEPDGSVDEHEYFSAHVPCPLLDLADRTCSVYRDRPTPCRTVLVFSAPAACAVPSGKRAHLAIDDLGHRAYGDHAAIRADEQLGGLAVGFLADFVMRAARRMGVAPDDPARDSR